MPKIQKILRLANRTCIFSELNAVDDSEPVPFDDINWKGDRTLKILEAVWLAAPLCTDFFETQTEKHFERLKEALRGKFYAEHLNCFKYGLFSINSTATHPLLVGFDSNSVTRNPTKCNQILNDFFNQYLVPQIEGLKVEMKVLKIQKCGENDYMQPLERKSNLLKAAIVGNMAERVPVKYLKITKHEFRDSMGKQGRAMKDCLLKDVESSRSRS